MDRRIQKTRNSLFSAFIELRASKPIEKITVKELTEKANISKQTFYLHFQDIYDLSEYLENDALQSLIGDIPNPEYMLTNPAEASRQLCSAFINQGHLFSILSRMTTEATVYSPTSLMPSSRKRYMTSGRNSETIWQRTWRCPCLYRAAHIPSSNTRIRIPPRSLTLWQGS